MKHANVALFIPHVGCPHRCSFCNQHSITGVFKTVTPDDVKETIERALNSLKENSIQAEIAFFGGSFTALDRDYMLSLLDAAAPYVARFRGIRLSTRPDAVDDTVLSLLKDYGVTSIELGSQSMSDEVLNLNERGHTAADVVAASNQIKRYGFSLGLQMMTGLYGSSDELDWMTAQEFVTLSPDAVRIYPTVVMKGTRLADLYAQGDYQPPTLDESVSLCAKLVTLFNEHDIRVIRLGLHASESLERDRIAGPFHPAFGELVESRILLNRLKEEIKTREKGEIKVAVNPRSISALLGNKKENEQILRSVGYQLTIIRDETVEKGDFVLR